MKRILVLSYLILCAFSLKSFALAPYPTCSSPAVDPDGDGWGWENGRSCRVESSNRDYPTCSSASSDPDGDGWGWENGRSCRVESSDRDYPTCSSASSDPDGDGWGWENGRSCRVASAPDDYPACTNPNSDPDGDGWGWENGRSCRVTGDGGNNGGGDNNTCSSVGSCPASLRCPTGIKCGCYTVRGLGANKRAYREAGADQSFLASAMMETSRMDTNYPYGDRKTRDAFNAGATKQNWGMMRQCYTPWKGNGPYDYALSAEMNYNRQLDVEVYKSCRSHFGDRWIAGHRNGSTGLNNPYTRDIRNFRRGYEWTYKQIANHQCDDVRFWVQIPEI